MEQYEIVRLQADCTVILPCRDGDIFLWLKDRSGFLSKSAAYDIADICFMSEGTSITITNRFVDLPSHIHIEVDEVAGYKNLNILVGKLNNGYKKNHNQLAVDVVPSYWRIRPGDYLIWMGEVRANQPSKGRILQIYGFDNGYLLINDPTTEEITKAINGEEGGRELTVEQTAELREAVAFIVAQGKARIVADNWTLG